MKDKRNRRVRGISLFRRLGVLCLLCVLPFAALALPSQSPAPRPPIHVSFIDQISPQFGPAINGLEERRRGPIFNAALQQVAQEGNLPPVVVINKDLSLPSTVLGEPKLAAGTQLVRIYLTQWSQSRLGGVADTEILCRFFVEIVRDGHVGKKLGPFFTRRTYDVVSVARPEDRWAQYQAAARAAIEEMAAALKKNAVI
jgi:hypothetical protein